MFNGRTLEVGIHPITSMRNLLNYWTGLHATRQVLRETLEWPTKYAAIFAKCPLRLRSG
jgi:hypothetical protein